ncbi:MAG: tetratricopeptide repeat protein [Proteobacteria bacterium]|nr:tetratricopeptide repeat protein [Pseudomonadota bacterium]MBU1743149.1 tetratricopeptide repeat protein [Pseudomonadota bacterium]
MSRIAPGVYLESRSATLGVGDTAQRRQLDNYWTARQIDEETVRIELLDMDDRPTGITEEVEIEEFEKRFVAQPGYLETREARQKQTRVEKIVALAERHYQDKEYNSAEFEFNNALKFDEDNVRANFGLGQTYVQMGETDKAREVFVRLSGIEAVFEERNKHLFNEFGIALRKMGLFEEAIGHYQKALSIVDDDENLYYNLGRVCHEKGDRAAAVNWLTLALKINPDFAEGRAYLAHLEATED